MIGVASRGILAIPCLETFLGEPARYVPASRIGSSGIDAAAGWGHKPTAEKVREQARRAGIPYLAIEDGFLRSVGLGVAGAAPVSLVVDDLGIYYDASRPSRLERLIAECELSEQMTLDAGRAMALIRQHRLSKYNHAPMLTLPPRQYASRVLVVDQTAGDASLGGGGCDANTFARMLAAAVAEHPDAEIWVKTHPDVMTGAKRGHFALAEDSGRVRRLGSDCCPLTLLEQVDHVYVATSQMGFEALLQGKPVTCFGLPWYAGWGVTDDRHPDSASLRLERRGDRSLEHLFFAAYISYARYVDPANGAPGTIFEAIDWLVCNKTCNDQTRGTLVCVGMTLWKRAAVKPFLAGPSNTIRFVRKLDAGKLAALPADTRLVLWGARHEELATAARERGVPVLRMEDGFVRSTGLGSDLHMPMSLALDTSGIYFDPDSRSDIETLLQTADLTPAELERGARVRAYLDVTRVSKYNVGGHFVLAPGAARRRVLLVPGQVEGDASLLAGSPKLARNADLLAAVRCANPDAWIVYKPHPDVLAGNRPGNVPQEDLRRLADQVAGAASVRACLDAVDEVHTMTSLTGFEALLLGKTVHCYGQPFYAGWGLTVDHLPVAHRSRLRTIDELAYVALCAYPRYRIPGREGFCQMEHVAAQIVRQRLPDGQPIASGWWSRRQRKMFALARLLMPRITGVVVSGGQR